MTCYLSFFQDVKESLPAESARCCPGHWREPDTQNRFVLSKEVRGDLPQHSVSHSQTGQYHANFTLNSVDFSIADLNRCHGADRISSEQSSHCDPLDIMVTGIWKVMHSEENQIGTDSAGGRP